MLHFLVTLLITVKYFLLKFAVCQQQLRNEV